MGAGFTLVFVKLAPFGTGQLSCGIDRAGWIDWRIAFALSVEGSSVCVLVVYVNQQKAKPRSGAPFSSRRPESATAARGACGGSDLRRSAPRSRPQPPFHTGSAAFGSR